MFEVDDDVESHAAALRYVDSQIEPLLDAFADRSVYANGYVGHRIGHDVVWTVPFAEGVSCGAASPRRRSRSVKTRSRRRRRESRAAAGAKDSIEGVIR